MSSFPLLKLPFVPLTNTLKCLDPIELYTLSQCSKKIMTTVKLAGTRKFILSVDFNEPYIIINDDYYFNCYDKSSTYYTEYKIIGYRSFGLEDEQSIFPIALHPYVKNCLIIFCNDVLIGLEKVFLHLTNVFGCRVDRFNTGYSLPFKNFRSEMEKIIKKQGEIRELAIGNDDFTDDELKWALDNVKVIDHFYIMVKTSERFRYNFKKLPIQLTICKSSWITFDNLLSFKSCTVLDLLDSHLTHHELDLFMQLWKTGNFEKLEYLLVFSEHLKNKKTIAGLTVTMNTQNPITREKIIMNETEQIRVLY